MPPRADRPSRFGLRAIGRLLLQLGVLAVVAAAVAAMVIIARDNLSHQRIASGLGFLDQTAGFGISQSLIPYAESDSYGRVLVVGLLNTLVVAVVGILLATVLGVAIGLARLSQNWLVARLAGAYVELVRNLPLLFQILFWYLAVLGTLPGPRESLSVGMRPLTEGIAALLDLADLGPAARSLVAAAPAVLADNVVFLNNRGLFVPRLIVHDHGAAFALGCVAAAILALVLAGVASRRRRRTGRPAYALWLAGGAALSAPAIVLVTGAVSTSLEVPRLQGFNFVGGLQVGPEFVALLAALSIYTAGFIAEIVRAGVLAVSAGQREAAAALGLDRKLSVRLIVMPQALRLIIPPLTSQYVNLTKNSSLAMVIGYPDLVAVFASTSLHQTGQAVEIIALTMAVYLSLSLITSAAMNWYNARLRFAER